MFVAWSDDGEKIYLNIFPNTMYPNRNVAGVSLGLKHQDGYKMSFYFYQL